VLLVLCGTSLAVWATNPFAALLLVPALHLWMWVVDPEMRPPALVRLMLILVGLVPPVLIAMYYASALGLGPIGMAWNGVLLLAGGHVGPVVALEWSFALGCFASVAVIASQSHRQDHAEPAPVTIRGPVTYAGPGSLGGTESALRR
jgi:hypothetical protein